MDDGVNAAMAALNPFEALKTGIHAGVSVGMGTVGVAGKIVEKTTTLAASGADAVLEKGGLQKKGQGTFQGVVASGADLARTGFNVTVRIFLEWGEMTV